MLSCDEVVLAMSGGIQNKGGKEQQLVGNKLECGEYLQKDEKKKEKEGK